MTELETEKPSYQSQPTMVLVYTNFKGKSKCAIVLHFFYLTLFSLYSTFRIHFSLSFPIHFRYQLAHNTSLFTKIYIPPPLIYLSCNRYVIFLLFSFPNSYFINFKAKEWYFKKYFINKNLLRKYQRAIHFIFKSYQSPLRFH